MASSNHLDGSRAANEQIAAHALKMQEEYLKQHGKPTSGEKKLKDSLNPIQEALAALGPLVEDVYKAIKKFHDTHDPLQIIGHFDKAVGKGFSLMGDTLGSDFGKFSGTMEDIGKPLINGLIGESMGIQLQSKDPDNTNAINTLYRVTGFCIAWQLTAVAAGMAGKITMKEHFPEEVAEIIGHAGEELGLSWMLGTLFETIFEQAVGKPLEEVINFQTHPNRVDWPVLRTLVRQHHMEKDDFRKYLMYEGFRSEDIDKLLLMDTKQLPVSELGQALTNGVSIPGGFEGYLKGQGYDGDDIALLTANYITHRETQAMDVLRSAARTALRDDAIDDGTFSSILQSTNMDATAIGMELQAVHLEKDTKKHTLTVAEIKAMYKDKILNTDSATTQLKALDYPDDVITNLLTLWDHIPESKERHMSASMVLSYLASGVIKQGEAQSKLQALGYNQADAAFMSENPRSKRARNLGNTPSLVAAAYRDKVIDYNTAHDRLTALGVDPQAIQLELQVAQYQQYPHTPAKGYPAKRLSEKDLENALGGGYVDTVYVMNYLEASGYSLDDALLLATMWTPPPTTPHIPPGGTLPPIHLPPTPPGGAPGPSPIIPPQPTPGPIPQ